MGFGDIKKLNQLDRGMSPAQVRALLGDPKQKELKAGRTVYKYSLHEWMAGYKPVYVVFDGDDRLAETMVDESEFLEKQKLWLRAFEK